MRKEINRGLYKKLKFDHSTKWYMHSMEWKDPKKITVDKTDNTTRRKPKCIGKGRETKKIRVIALQYKQNRTFKNNGIKLYCNRMQRKQNILFPSKCTNCGRDHPVHARSCESWRQEMEVLIVKHQNNIPYYEARKLVLGAKTIPYSQAVQRNKSPYKYERLLKP